MKIFLTGGAGFIGSHLTRSLLAHGHTVVCIDNLNDFYDPNIKVKNLKEFESNREYHFYQNDIRDKGALKMIFNTHKIDLVVHLAAQAGVRPSIEDPELYYAVNIMGTLNILEQMKASGCKKMIFGSSSSVYGNNKKTPFSELDPVDNPISPYAATKKSGELLCHTFHKLYNIDIFCLRFFSVYGPGQRPEMAIAKFTKAIFEGDPIPMYGDGSSERDYTYVDDIVNGILLSINNLKGFDIFNLGEASTISLKNLIHLIENICEKKALINELPMQAGDVTITYADNSKAKELLGYSPKTNIEEGVRRYVNWYRRNFFVNVYDVFQNN